MSDSDLQAFISDALAEDTGDGDHSSLASLPAGITGRARLLVKETGIIAGLRVASEVFNVTDPSLETSILLKDGDSVKYGDIALTVEGAAHSILRAERLVLDGREAQEIVLAAVCEIRVRSRVRQSCR